MAFERRKSRVVKIGSVEIGGNNPIAVQSMLNTSAHDIEGSVKQAVELENAGCQIIRAAIPDMEAVSLIPALKAAVKAPIVADIHFDYRLALASIDAGIDKIRINPGNIGKPERVKAVADACKEHNIPIRVGVNSGSIEKGILEKYGGPTAQGLVESALNHVRMLEDCDFYNTVISLKSSDVAMTVEAYELISKLCDYPLHVGITEAGTWKMSLVKSSAGVGSLLLHGIGDTIRISMTDSVLKEVQAGYDILKATGLKTDCPEIVSCPTCGRTRIDLISLANQVEARLVNCHKPIKVAVMGCIVNGPGEAREADIGIAGGDGCGLIFKKGEVIKKVPENEIVDELMAEIEKM